MVGGFDNYESFLKCLCYWCEVLPRAVIESERLALK